MTPNTHRHIRKSADFCHHRMHWRACMCISYYFVFLGRVEYFLNEGGFSVESSLQGNSSNSFLWKRTDSSVVHKRARGQLWDCQNEVTAQWQLPIQKRFGERCPHVCRVKITFALLPTDLFVSTTTNSMECAVDSIPLRTCVDSRNT